MFIQVIRGRVSDRAGMERQMERWLQDVAPGATGWLGGTFGTDHNGEDWAIVRFESKDAARANSDRSEQGAWWAETEKLYESSPTFLDLTNTGTIGAGGSDDAGFVQIITGRATDLDGLRDMVSVASEDLPRRRPDVIGATVGWTDDGQFVQTVYFTNEEEARAGERSMQEGEGDERMERFSAMTENVSYHDLREPRMLSP